MVLKVAVLRGGWSGEREVSLKTGQFVLDNLDRTKYQPFDVVVNSFSDLSNLKSKADFVFIALHGRFGEGGTVQSVLDLLKIPYSSASALASRLAMNKTIFKRVVKTEAIQVADDLVLDYVGQRMLAGSPAGYKQILSRVCLRQSQRLIKSEFGYPVFIKPDDAGSSLGISKVSQISELRPAVKEARKYSDIILIEKAVSGVELTVSFVGKEILPSILIKPKKANFFDYQSKYSLGGSDEICPAPIPARLETRLKRLTLKIKKIIGIKTYGRVDYIWNDKTDEIYTLEANTVPGMTATSLLPRAALAYGWPAKELLNKIIASALTV